MAKFRVVTHVIFDMDGLLLDTERLYTIATQAVTSEFGKDYPYDLKEKCMGKTELAANQLLIDALGLPLTVDEFISKLKKHFEELFPTSELMPGAEKLVRHLSAHKIPIAIATGSNKWKYDLKTQNHKELFDLFHHKVLIGDDPEVHHGKPQPDCFLVSASRFPEKPSPDKVLVFEDSGNGVMAAHGAGMQCVWVPDPQTTTAHLATKATQIIPSLQDFRPEDYGLPPFNNS